MTEERGDAAEAVTVGMQAQTDAEERAELRGRYGLECFDEGGRLLWSDEIDNLVTTVGKNAILTDTLAGSAYTVTGPFLGVISSASFSAVSAADTMASHAGWLEATGAQAPTMSSNRATVTFAAASGGAMASSSTNSFVFTGSGTVQGLFMAFGTGAVNTPGDTNGTLLSAGTLAAAQPVIGGNTIQATYTLSV